MFKTILILISFIIISCSSYVKENVITDQSLYKNNLLEDYELYEKANNHIENKQLDLALKELKKIEVLFPSSKFANKGMLVKAYIHFLKKDYEKTRVIAENYKEYYPGSKDVVYANYLEAMTYYVLIKKPNFSQKNALTALEKFNFILNAYPNSKYEIDIITKKQVISNNLAASKLTAAKFYLNKNLVIFPLLYMIWGIIFSSHDFSSNSFFFGLRFLELTIILFLLFSLSFTLNGSYLIIAICLS